MKRLLFFSVMALAMVAGSWFFFDPEMARGLLRAASTQEQHGHARVAVGDRHVTIRFPRDFPTAPIIQLTSRTPAAPRSSVRHVSSSHFTIELDERADSDVDLYWTALWNRWNWSFFDDREAPDIYSISVEMDGESIPIQLTGETLHEPTEFWIDGRHLDAVEASKDELTDAVLAAATKARSEEMRCDLLERLKSKLRIRARECPPRPEYESLADWDAGSRNDWMVLDESSGIRIVHRDHYDESTTDDAVRQSLAGLLRQAAAFDVMPHNNQVIDFIDALLEDGVLDGARPMTFIHFDTHSDLHAYKDPRGFVSPEHIGDFLNTLIVRGLVEQVYWVMPDWTREPIYAVEYFDPVVAEFTGPNIGSDAYEEGPAKLDIYVDKSTGLAHMASRPTHVDADDLIRVPFHKVTLDELPDIADYDNVYLELDADYFSNTGYLTKLFGGDNPSVSDLKKLLVRMARTLEERRVEPKLASICLSPLFTTTEDRAYMNRIFLEAAQDSGLHDYLIGYRHVTVKGRTRTAKNVRRDNLLGRLAVELAKLDARDIGADERIPVQADDPEFRSAQSIASMLLGVDKYTAESVIMKMDRFDGQLDGTLNLVDFEYYVAFEDPQWVLDKSHPGREDDYSRRITSIVSDMAAPQ